MSGSGQLKPRVRLSRARAFGAWTSLGHPSITEIFSSSGVDFVGIDLEHSTISLEQAQRIIAASQAAGLACFPRVSSHNGEQVRRLLDCGADGIIVPMVSTAAQVHQIIDWCKYPPVGKRSYGVARAQEYGFEFQRYTDGWNATSTLIIQIESIEGVKNLDELLSYEQVDGVMVGPYDLSGSLGIPGQLSHPSVQEACTQITEVCKRFGKACGTQIIDTTRENVSAAFSTGYTFVVLASDVFVLWKWSEKARNVIGEFAGRTFS